MKPAPGLAPIQNRWLNDPVTYVLNDANNLRYNGLSWCAVFGLNSTDGTGLRSVSRKMWTLL